AGADRFRADILRLAGAAVEARHLAAIDEVRIERVGSDIAILLDADRVKLAEGDLAMRATTAHGRRAAFLLAAIDPVGKLVVGDDVIELGRRLVVPGTPGLAAVECDNRALVASQKNDLRIVGID